MAEGTESTPHTYPQGVPSWVELVTPDLEHATQFYGRLFGWTFEDAMPPGAPEPYLVAKLRGKDAAGIVRGDGPQWITYIAVDDADATSRRAVGAGATLIEAPADAGAGGRWSEIRDPRGATFRLWQAGDRLGSQVNNAPGSWNFSDLHTDDLDAGLAFYRGLFGWEVADMGPDADHTIRVPGYGDHLESTVDPDIRTRQAFAPEGFADAIGGAVRTHGTEAPRWYVTFAVEDLVKSIDTLSLGGGEALDRRRTEWAFASDVIDPWGAGFALSQFTPPS